jgi:ribosomal-protein-alanine N-acetyltransferase
MSDSFERQTPRLLLRRWRDADREPFAAQGADPEVMRHFHAPLDRAASDATYDRIVAHWEKHGWGPWAAELRASGEFVGFVGILVPRFPLPGNPPVEIGWRLGRAHWGRGYATEGAREALAMGFGPVGQPEIVAVTTLGNAASRNVMRKLGMRDAEANFVHPGIPADSHVQPHCLYRITREEWSAHPP